MDLTNRNDVTNLIFRTIVPLFGCVAAAMATVYIMQEINPLAAFCLCASAVFFVMAAVSPKAGFILLLFQCAYSDLLKRFLVFWGDLSFEQVGYVLAGAPVVVAGLFVSVVTQSAFHRLRISLRDVLMLGLVGVVVALNFLLAKRTGAANLESLKQAANSGLYMMLAPIAIKLITSQEQVGQVLLITRLMFLPVAAYGIFQAIFGLADFEIAYLQTGLTVMAKELFDVRPRPFSTLNSGTALSIIAGAFALLALYPIVKSGRETPYGERMKSIAMSGLYFAAALSSLVRAGVVTFLIGLVALWSFSTPSRTRLFYVSGAVGFLTLVFSASFLLENLAAWDPANDARSDIVGQAVRIQTYAERLKGFVNLTQSTDMYSLFGLREDQKMTATTYHHDPISGLLVDFGIVGVACAGAAFFFGARFVHRRILALPAGAVRGTAVLLTAMDAGILISHLLFNGIFTTFPINTFFWLFAGMLAVLLLDESQPPDASPETPSERVSEPNWSRIGVPLASAGAPDRGSRAPYGGGGRAIRS